MFADRFTEGLTDLGVFARKLEGAFRDADAARGDIDASELEAARGLEEALAFDAADQVRRGTEYLGHGRRDSTPCHAQGLRNRSGEYVGPNISQEVHASR